MNYDSLVQFVDHLEKLSKSSGTKEFVQDSAGTYLKCFYLNKVIGDARELIKYGEYKIALENILENLKEASISLNENMINLAYCASENENSKHISLLLDALQAQAHGDG